MVYVLLLYFVLQIFRYEPLDSLRLLIINGLTNVLPTMATLGHLLTICNMAAPKKLDSVAIVSKRTIPTERPPLVGEVSAKLCV
jgi:hypothetical protein